MPRQNIFQKKRQEARDTIIFELASRGNLTYEEVARIIKERHGDVLSKQRIHQIVSLKLKEENGTTQES